MTEQEKVQQIDDELTRRSLLALAQSRERGEVMTYARDGWIFREDPGRRIVRLCRTEEFVAANYPDDIEDPQNKNGDE